MAKYDYRCPKCGKIEEHIHTIVEVPIFRCETCDKIMRKVFNAPAVVYNAPGFTKAAAL